MSSSSTQRVSNLPTGFDDLHDIASRWSHESHRARHRQRVESSLAQLTNDYETLMPRIEAALDHLDPLGDPDVLEGPDRNLFLLCLSLSDIAFAIERLGSPNIDAVIDVFRFQPSKGDAYM